MTVEEYEASGDLYFAQEDYTMAFVQYEKSLGLSQATCGFTSSRGCFAFAAGKPEEGGEVFSKRFWKPTRAWLRPMRHGHCAFEMRQYEEAERHLLKAVEIDRTLWKARNYLGNIYDFQKKYDEASRQYAQAILFEA